MRGSETVHYGVSNTNSHEIHISLYWVQKIYNHQNLNIFSSKFCILEDSENTWEQIWGGAWRKSFHWFGVGFFLVLVGWLIWVCFLGRRDLFWNSIHCLWRNPKYQYTYDKLSCCVKITITSLNQENFFANQKGNAFKVRSKSYLFQGLIGLLLYFNNEIHKHLKNILFPSNSLENVFPVVGCRVCHFWAIHLLSLNWNKESHCIRGWIYRHRQILKMFEHFHYCIFSFKGHAHFQ